MSRKTMFRAMLSMVLILACMFLSRAVFAAPETILRQVTFNHTKTRSLNIGLIFSRKIKKQQIHSFMTKTARAGQTLIIDLMKVKNGSGHKRKVIKSSFVRSLLAIQSKDKTRLSIRLKGSVGYRIKVQGRRAVITIAHKLFAASNTKRSVLKKKNPGQNWIKHIDFKRMPNGGGKLIVTLGTNKSEIDMTQAGNMLNLEFIATHLPKQQHRKLKLSDFGTPLDQVTLRQKGKNILMQLHLHGHYTHLAYQSKNLFVVDIQPVVADSQPRTSILRTNYTGDKVTLNFQNIEVRSVLQLLAEFTGLNIVTDDAVNGTITLHLKNVPWDQAFSIILRMRGLAERQIGNIILVAPAKTLADKEKSELQSITQMQKLAPLHSELLQINYARAEDLTKLIKSQKNSLLSARGRISTDARTNTLWLRDTNTKLGDIRSLIEKLDVPVRQVSIEARIVTISSNYLQDFGINFGVSKAETPLSGTQSAANEFKKGTVGSKITPLASRYNVTLPTTEAATAHIGVALAKLGHGFMVDLELQAMEKDSKGKVISAPHLITANQHTAKIEKGQEIPFNQSTSSGATAVTFKKAVLSLEVTPQITPDKKVTLNLKVHKDTPKNQGGNVNGTSVVAIDTNNIETQVQVNDGATVVIGGIYEQTKHNNISRVPILSDIPLLGELFESKHLQNQRDELLVFITPRIIEQKAFIS